MFIPLLAAAATHTADPPLWLIAPFALLLLSIACGPLLAPHFWEHHYAKVAVALGLIPVCYYAFILGGGGRLLHVGGEYVSFIVFIGSLFVVAGGVHLRTKGGATPGVNVAFLAIGAFLANLVGTTGASMLLIRPWIRMNKYRFTGLHTAFFIFTVSNVGGCLTPIGDPPLFLGYLKGVPFFWTMTRCLFPWATALALILTIFWVVDRRNFFRAPREIREKETAHEEFKIEGYRNFGFLAVILVAVIAVPASVPGLREALMLAAAVASYRTTAQPIHDANHFTFAPIKEVAWLFLGIFATMVPALDYLELHAGQLGISEPIHFYWLTGILSSVLDNAPTYLTFLAAAFGLKNLTLDDPAQVHEFLAQHPAYLVAISLAAVFFGAGTYIGNGPNLMVKSICDHAKVHTPPFFEYILRFSLPVLLPIFALIAWIFLRK
ncbi:MAG: sodium:proton antiporter [Chthoniobacteraceae bacterium]